MTVALVIPIHLDALCLSTNRLVVEAMADFSRLPYVDRNLKQEINADTANISEEIVSQPFTNQNLWLKAGVHLHWALPDALTKGVQDENTTRFPPIPDRWLVIRRASTQAEQAWVVESNYAYPPKSRRSESRADQADYVPYTQDMGARSGSVSYYCPDADYDEPFRFVGRKVSLNLWLQEQQTEQSYLETITAVGYGEPTFAAFYPNCHSILGFHDDETTQIPKGLEYEVFGWYSHSDDDCLKSLLKSQETNQLSDLRQVIREQFKWSIEGESATVPDQILCYGKLSFDDTAKSSMNSLTYDTVKDLEIAVGNTPMEALAAYLSHQIAPILGIGLDDRPKMEKLEDQLESIHLSSYLEHQELDVGQICKAVRHELGFKTAAIDPQWLIRADTKQAQDNTQVHVADTQKAQTQERLILPLYLNQQLQKLNNLQQQLTKSQSEVAVKRRQLFSDWYKFMLAAYPPLEANRGDDYPDVDAVCHFIQTKDIQPLKSQIQAADQLETQLKDALNQLNASLSAYNNSTIFQLEVNSSQPKARSGEKLAKSVSNCSEYHTLSGDPQIIADTTKTFQDCLNFDGVDDACELKNFSSNLIKDSLTFSIWFKQPAQKESARSTNNAQRLITFQNEQGSPLLSLQIRTDHRLLVQQAADKWFAPQMVTSDRWHHLALTIEHEGNTHQVIIYLNGKRQLRLKCDRATVRSIQVGNGTTGERAFQGQIAQIRLDNRVLSIGEIARNANRLPQIPYLLQQTLDQRYWQPNEPVVLLTGEGIQPTDRHGQDGRDSKDGTLACPLIDLAPQLQELLKQKFAGEISDLIALLNQLSQSLNTTLTATTSAAMAFKTWTEQPWHPLLMEWEVQMQPAQSKTNLTNGGYAHDVITENYTLSDGEVDLEIKQNKRSIGAGTSYSNSCILTSHAALQFADKITAYLKQNLFDRHEEFKQLDSDDRYYQALQTWYKRNPKRKPKPLKNQQHYTGVVLLHLRRYKRKPKPLKNQQQRLNIAAIKKWYEGKPLPLGKSAPADASFSRLGDSNLRSQDPIYIALLAYEALYPNGKPKYFLSQSLGGFNAELLMYKQTLQLPVKDPLSFDRYQQLTEEVRELLGNNLGMAPEPLNQFTPIRSGAMQITRLRLIDTFGQVREFNSEQSVAGVLTPQRLTVPHSPHLIWLPPRIVQPARLDFQWLAATELDPASTPICGWILPNMLNSSLGIYDEQGKALGTIAQGCNKIEWQPAPGSNRTFDEIENESLRKLVQHLLSKSAELEQSSPHPYLEHLLTAIESALNGIDPENSAQHQSLALLIGRPLAVVRASLDIELQGGAAVNQGWQSFRLAMNRTMRETDNFTRVQFPIRVGECYRFNDGIVGYWKEAGDGYEMDKFYVPKMAPHQKIQHPDIVLRNHRWILKQTFFNAFPNDAEEIWQQLLEKGWLRSLGNDKHSARIETTRPDLNRKDQPQIEEILNERSINPLHILQSIDSPPQALTLLIDPRGLIHGASGILPTKTLNLSPDEYGPALEAIEVTFLRAPILTPQQTRTMPLSIEPGFSWSWLEHKPQIAKSVFLDILQNQEDALTLEDATKLWDHLLTEQVGWLKALGSDETVAQIVPMGRRALETISEAVAKDLGQERSQLEDQIEHLFWSEIQAEPTLSKSRFMRCLFDQIQTKGSLEEFSQTTGQTLWDSLLAAEVGWLKPVERDPTRAEVVPKENRICARLNPRSLTNDDTLPKNLADILETVFDLERLLITSSSTQAHLGRSQELREGWLMLSKAK